MNDTLIPIALTINFPSNPIALLPKSEKYLRVFLFPDTLMPGIMQDAYNFGVTGIKLFLDTGLNKPTMLKTKIQPKNEHILYIGVLFNADGLNALTRAKLFINGQGNNDSFLPVKSIITDTKNRNKLDLTFGIGIDPPHNYSLIPCGQITFEIF